MPDTCICPDCHSSLDVEIYGNDLECSECGCKLSVYPDSAIRVDTPVGTLWVTLPWRGEI
jgi:hypothetical protein